MHDEDVLAEHFLNLARWNGIRLNLTNGSLDTSHAHPTVGSICMPPIVCEVGYAVAMHELGHCLAPHAGGDPAVGFAECRLQEELAWIWAETHAKIWTPTMEHVKQVCLATYTEVAWQRREAQRAREREDPVLA